MSKPSKQKLQVEREKKKICKENKRYESSKKKRERVSEREREREREIMLSNS